MNRHLMDSRLERRKRVFVPSLIREIMVVFCLSKPWWHKQMRCCRTHWHFSLLFRSFPSLEKLGKTVLKFVRGCDNWHEVFAVVVHLTYSSCYWIQVWHVYSPSYPQKCTLFLAKHTYLLIFCVLRQLAKDTRGVFPLDFQALSRCLPMGFRP